MINDHNGLAPFLQISVRYSLNFCQFVQTVEFEFNISYQFIYVIKTILIQSFQFLCQKGDQM